MASRPGSPSDRPLSPKTPPSSPIVGPSCPPPSPSEGAPLESTPLLDGAQDIDISVPPSTAPSVVSSASIRVITYRPSVLVLMLVVHYLFVGVLVYIVYRLLGGFNSACKDAPGGSGPAGLQD